MIGLLPVLHEQLDLVVGVGVLLLEDIDHELLLDLRPFVFSAKVSDSVPSFCLDVGLIIFLFF